MKKYLLILKNGNSITCFAENQTQAVIKLGLECNQITYITNLNITEP